MSEQDGPKNGMMLVLYLGHTVVIIGPATRMKGLYKLKRNGLGKMASKVLWFGPLIWTILQEFAVLYFH